VTVVKKLPPGTTPLRMAGKRVQTTTGGSSSPSSAGKSAKKAVGRSPAKKTGIARALSNPGASKRSATATARLTANAAKKAGRKSSAKKSAGGKWIAGAIEHPGALHKDLGVAQGKKIPAAKLAAAAKRPGTVGRRARLAQTLSKMNK
jgi:hypothetical protein